MGLRGEALKRLGLQGWVQGEARAPEGNQMDVTAVRTALPQGLGEDQGPVRRSQLLGPGLLGGVTWGGGVRRARQLEKG